MIAPVLASSSSSRTRITIALLAGLLAASVVSVSHAGMAPQPDADAPRLTVDYKDLDLSSEKDALTLYRRIETAARQVCPQPTKYSMRVTELSRKCVAAAISRAVNEVNSPQLAKLNAVRNKRVSEG
jgi:UrcA family protein